MRIHLDTDFGGDTDDACALAMVLGWPDVDVTGITTVADPIGQRAGYVEYFLGLAGRGGIPVAAGAALSLGAGKPMGGVGNNATYWGVPIAPHPSSPGTALDLIGRSVDLGASIVGIGPFTNLAALEAARPGLLTTTSVVLMGGWVRPPDEGLPQWGPEADWNVQRDPRAAQMVAIRAEPTLVTLPATLKAHLRAQHLHRLEASGPLGQLLARQARAHAAEFEMGAMGRAHALLPDDLLNFQYDAVACAVALGWSGAHIESMTLRPVDRDGMLRFELDQGDRSLAVVTDIDGAEFAELWMSRVEAASRNGKT